MSTKHESMMGIMKLYELRREETMRKARDWFVTFNPSSIQDIVDTFTGEHSAYYRMVTTYWDMAASFVNHGAIDEQMFNDAVRQVVPIFEKALASRKNKDYTIKIFPKAHHIILEAETGSDEELPRLKRYVPGYFDTMTDWLRKRVKAR